MSFADHRRPRGPALIAAIAVQGAVGYALIAGLAYTMIPHVDSPIRAYRVPLPPPPPTPEPRPQPQHRESSAPIEQIDVSPPPIPTLPTVDPVPTPQPQLVPPVSSTGIDPNPLPSPGPSASPAIDHSRGVSPLGNQGDWFPQDAYPGGALERGAEGRVSVTVGIGTDGRVTDCAVISSSGDHDLDEATCRLARRNGRFSPALDKDGRAVPSSTTLRNVRWVITG